MNPAFHKGGLTRGRTSMRVRGENVSPSKSFSPIFPSRKAAKKEFAAAIHEESNGDLATITDCSKETVKCWKAARGFPVGDRLMDMASPGGSPTVRRWVAVKLGFVDPIYMDAIMAAAYQVSHQQNPDGDAVRADLAERMKVRE